MTGLTDGDLTAAAGLKLNMLVEADLGWMLGIDNFETVDRGTDLVT